MWRHKGLFSPVLEQQNSKVLSEVAKRKTNPLKLLSFIHSDIHTKLERIKQKRLPYGMGSRLVHHLSYLDMFKQVSWCCWFVGCVSNMVANASWLLLLCHKHHSTCACYTGWTGSLVSPFPRVAAWWFHHVFPKWAMCTGCKCAFWLWCQTCWLWCQASWLQAKPKCHATAMTLLLVTTFAEVLVVSVL